MTALVHQALLNVDDWRDLRHRARPGVWVEIIRIGRRDVAVVDIGHHPHGDRHIGRRQTVLQGHTAFDRLAKFPTHAHGLPEDIVQAGTLSVLRHFSPAIDRDPDQLFPPRGIVVILVGEDGELCSNRVAAEIADDVGKGLEPVDVIATYLRVRMAEMIEPTVGTGHSGRHPDARTLHGGLHLPGQPTDRRGLPGRVDELMRQLQVADFQVTRRRLDQIVRVGEAVDQWVGIQGQRQGHGHAHAAADRTDENHSRNAARSASVKCR